MSKPSRSRVIAATRGALRGQAGLPKALRSRSRQATLKARLKRAQAPTIRPKGRLPNSDDTVEDKRRRAQYFQTEWIKAVNKYGVDSKEARQALTTWRYWSKKAQKGRRNPSERYFVTSKGMMRGFYRIVDSYADPKAATVQTGKSKALLVEIAKELNSGKRKLGISGTRQNPGFFGSEATAQAKRVTKIRPVVHVASGEKGEIIGTAPGGFIKVQWRGRTKPTLIKRSELKRGRYPNVTVNPGLLDIAYGLNAYDSIAKRKIRNPTPKEGREVITEAKDYLNRTWDSTETENRAFHQLVHAYEYAGFNHVRAMDAATRELNKKRKKRFKNPSIREISKTFQGRASNAIRELKAANSAPSNLARLGSLVLLRVKGMRRDLRIPGSMVAADTKGRIWLAGTRAPLLTLRAKSKEQRLDAGEIEKIVYGTAKSHIGGGKAFEYDHDFEDPKPHLYIDHEGMPIIHGGGYKITEAGIEG